MSKTRFLIAAALAGWAVTLIGWLASLNANMSPVTRIVARILLEPVFACLTLSHKASPITDNLFVLFIATLINIVAWAAMVYGLTVLVQHLRRSAASHRGIVH